MDKIHKEILSIFYQKYEAIKKDKGIFQSQVFRQITNKQYQAQELSGAFHWLIANKYIEEFYTYAVRNSILMPKPLYNRALPDIEQHLQYIITDLGRQAYLASLQQKVFIIHGHSEPRWRELKDLLTERFKLIPVILSEQSNQGSTIIEKFEYYAKQCVYAFAIFTPDDIIENNGKRYFQARPNVIFELGWFTAYLGRNKVCILYQDIEKNSIFSDFDGIVQCRFFQQIQERYLDIEKELQQAGIITLR
jgi:predicted nucleotide-binding protein